MPLGGCSGAFRAPLGVLLGLLGGLLGPPGASSGTRIELSVFIPPLGPLLGLSGGYLGLSWAPLRPF